MRNPIFTSAAAAAALALSPLAHADEESPLIGTWHGTWPGGTYAELTVTHIADDATARGIYCNIYKTHMSWWDMHPDQVTGKVDRRGRLKFRFNKVRWEYRPRRNDPDTLQLIWRKGQRKHTLDMERVDPDAAACRSRIATLDEDPVRTDAPAGEHALVGAWAGDWPDRDSTTEIAVDTITGDQAKGTYCHRQGLRHSIYDLHPGGPTPASYDGEAITFDALAKPHPNRWRFTRRDEALHLEFSNREGKDFTLDMTHTETPCLDRVSPVLERN